LPPEVAIFSHYNNCVEMTKILLQTQPLSYAQHYGGLISKDDLVIFGNKEIGNVENHHLVKQNVCPFNITNVVKIKLVYLNPFKNLLRVQNISREFFISQLEDLTSNWLTLWLFQQL
jgi:hypothetical protein